MVLKKIREVLNGNDDKYETLYYKYSKTKLENQKLKKNHEEELKKYKLKLHKNVAIHLIALYDEIENAKNSSFKVRTTDKDIQKLLIDLNKSEKSLNDTFKLYHIEPIIPKEKFFDPELHDIARYESARKMNKGLIIKTVKKGFKFRNEILKKPRVVITK